MLALRRCAGSWSLLVAAAFAAACGEEDASAPIVIKAEFFDAGGGARTEVPLVADPLTFEPEGQPVLPALGYIVLTFSEPLDGESIETVLKDERGQVTAFRGRAGVVEIFSSTPDGSFIEGIAYHPEVISIHAWVRTALADGQRQEDAVTSLPADTQIFVDVIANKVKDQDNNAQAPFEDSNGDVVKSLGGQDVAARVAFKTLP